MSAFKFHNSEKKTENVKLPKVIEQKRKTNSQIACEDIGKALLAELKVLSSNFSSDTIFPRKLPQYRSNFPWNISPNVLVRIKFCWCKGRINHNSSDLHERVHVSLR